MKEREQFLKSLFKKNDVVVIATSGGPDSMYLLHVINNIKKDFNLKIICAHVNHNLRKESEKEKDFVKEYCKVNNIIFEYMKIDGYENNKFTENEARCKRYEFFDRLIIKYKGKYLLTAHHGDDLIETILMRIVRGSNLKGYIGIPKIQDNGKYKIVRPLLYLNKKDILDYLDENNIKYMVDKSNEDEKYTRNRFRKRTLPFLKQEDKNVHLKFLNFSEELEENNNYINSIVNDKFKKVVKNKAIQINKLLEEDIFIQKKIIERVIGEYQKEEIFNIDKKDLNNILNLVNSNNKEINLKDKFIARKSYNKLYIEKNKETKKYHYIFEDELSILDKYYFYNTNNSKVKSNYVIRLSSKDIKLPLIIRTKIDGDKIEVKNLSGTKKVKDIFIDEKIDKKKRSEYPIVTDSNNVVLWIPGIKKSKFDKDISEKCDIIIKYVEEKNE